MSSDLADFTDLVASARMVVEELLEEGVLTFEPTGPALPSAPEPVIESQPAPTPAMETPPAPQPSQPSQSPRASEAQETGSVALAPGDWGPAPTLEAVRDVLGDCRRCGLSEGRTQIVFGDGNPDADLLFVGEGPGEQEDLRGLPFVGKAGELLTQMIEKGLGIARQDVYICNVVKCRPPGNRDPLAEEVAACSAFLDGQIAAVSPKVIISLGKPAASLLLGRKVAITRERGTWQSYRGIPLMPTLHPAFVLRQYTEANRRAVWEDLKAALARTRES